LITKLYGLLFTYVNGLSAVNSHYNSQLY